MKKLFSIILIIGILFAFIPEKLFAQTDKEYFVVTAYYSPLPNQDYYLKGSYKADIRLNGKGIAGASGKKVFSGMLAAPKNYKFGTKIELDGLGVGSVEDRGGAIVNAGNRGYSDDRIDVWMGYGDDGLKRALYWGKRRVEGKIIDKRSNVTLNYKNISSPDWVVKSLKKIPSIFNISIGKKSNKEDILSLKKFLSKIGFYKGKVNNIYSNDLISEIYDFQVQTNILKKGDILGAGYWGKKTRSEFLEQYKNGELEDTVGKNNNYSNNVLLQGDENITKSDYIDNNVILNGDDNIDKTKFYTGEKEGVFKKTVKTDEEVIELQKILQKLELYNGNLDGDYKSIQNIILKYQLDNNIVKSKNILGAGFYGPKTRLLLYQDYIKYKENKEKERIKQEKRLQKIVKIKIELQDLQDEALQKAEKKILDLGSLSFGNISPQVRELQLLLKNLGYFDKKDTAIYGRVTKNAIIDFQLEKNIISKNGDTGAGNFGPVTKMNLIQTLSIIYYDELVEKKNYDSEIMAEIKNQVL